MNNTMLTNVRRRGRVVDLILEGSLPHLNEMTRLPFHGTQTERRPAALSIETRTSPAAAPFLIRHKRLLNSAYQTADHTTRARWHHHPRRVVVRLRWYSWWLEIASCSLVVAYVSKP